MTRRVCLTLLATVGSGFAQEPQTSARFPLLTRVAEALSENNASEALHYFDRRMPGYEMFAANLHALAAQYLIGCSIEFLDSSVAGNAETLQLDWFLQLRSKAEDGPLVRRRERVTVTVAGGRITAFAPLALLKP